MPLNIFKNRPIKTGQNKKTIREIDSLTTDMFDFESHRFSVIIQIRVTCIHNREVLILVENNKGLPYDFIKSNDIQIELWHLVGKYLNVNPSWVHFENKVPFIKDGAVYLPFSCSLSEKIPNKAGKWISIFDLQE